MLTWHECFLDKSFSFVVCSDVGQKLLLAHLILLEAPSNTVYSKPCIPEAFGFVFGVIDYRYWYYSMSYGSIPAIDIIVFWSGMFCRHRVWRRPHRNILQDNNVSVSSFDFTSTLCEIGRCIDSCDIYGSHRLLYWYPYIWMWPEIGYARVSGNQWLHSLVRFTNHW